jgi:hypothetical protein
VSVPSSELCASMCRKGLVWIRDQWRARYPSDAEYEKACLNAAKDMGVPHAKRYAITFPGTVSLDCDTRHAHVFTRLSWPRLTEDQMDNIRVELVKDILGKDLPHISLFRSMGSARSRKRHNGVSISKLKATRDKLLEQLRKHDEACDLDSLEQRLWYMSLNQSVCICIKLLQRLPLVGGTAEIHSPAEHKVRSCKHDIKQDILALDTRTPDVKKGKLYQDMIEKAIKKRGTGKAHRHHVSRSIEKLKCILQILKTPRNKVVTVHYKFGKGKKETHVVRGTAGGYIKQRCWT